ncbi:MAG: YdbL family protein [Proteobacteria bacterium]|nr:YdbL family protein [Pseudomonadota bacterium]
MLNKSLRAGAAALALALAAVPMTALVTQPAFADLASDKATVDAAKAAGVVGEQGDGYLGYVNGSADPATTAAVSAINAGRAAVYRQTAAKSGVTPDAAGQATGAQLLAKVPSGQFYKPLGGSWTKK